MLDVKCSHALAKITPALSFKTFFTVRVRFYALCTKRLRNRAHVISPPRPSLFSVCNIENVGVAWERGYSKSVVADLRPLSYFRSYTEQPLTLGSTIDGTRSQSRRQSHPSTPPPNHTIHCHNTELNCLLKSISMPNYLCRPAELNSSSPVLPEGATVP